MGKRRALSDSSDFDGGLSSSSDADWAEPTKKGSRQGTSRHGKRVKKDEVALQVAKGLQQSVSHFSSLHMISSPQECRTALLRWYSDVEDARGMPWRKPYNPNLGPEEKAQRAYEVWVSEVMLQQTQVATVIPYYNRWMEKYTPISWFSLLEQLIFKTGFQPYRPYSLTQATASIEEVNAVWKGLGYYSRASRLLNGAQKAVRDYGGKLPDNAKEMEANIPGIGRYSAGAICSIAYGERVPVLDGNVHRLLSRLLALHAPPKAKATLDILWQAATDMVLKQLTPTTIDSPSRNSPDGPLTSDSYQHPGDINQALIELGSTVCKVRDPQCESCPLQPWCAGYAIASRNNPTQQIADIEEICSLCVDIPSEGDVTVYPMKAARKKAREELDIVNVIEWRRLAAQSQDRFFLVVRRPDDGLLAGLYEFPTKVDVPRSITASRLEKVPNELLSTILLPDIPLYIGPSKVAKAASDSSNSNNAVTGRIARIAKIEPMGDVLHIFSHIKKTYRVQWVVLEGGDEAPELRSEPHEMVKEQKSSGAKKKAKSKAAEKLTVATASPSSLWDLPGSVHQLIASSSFASAVLNISKAATLSDINERHRALSLIFHPDKQHDERSKESATGKFLEIQKAYQVLSDPFLRDVYDALGEEGLSINWPEEIRSKSREEVLEALEITKVHILQRRLKDAIHPRGRLSCGIDASALFGPYLGSSQDGIAIRMLNRIEDVQLISTELRHSVQKKVHDNTHVSFMARLNRQGRASGMQLMGTLRHQFSPRLTSEMSVMLLKPHVVNLNTSYRDDNNAISLRASISPTTLHLLPPSLNVSITRKLFPRRFEQATLGLNLARHPQVSFNFISPVRFDIGGLSSYSPPVDHIEPGDSPSLPPVSGLRSGTTHRSCGFVLDGRDPKLMAEWGVLFNELAVQAKVGLELGISGLSWVFSGAWSNQNGEISATTYLNALGVVLKLEFAYLDQRLAIPLILSQQHDPAMAFWTVAIPSTTFFLGYHFIVKPRRRARRLAFIRAARRSLEEETGVGRQREGVAVLLKDTARKYTQAETAKGGLVINEAIYGAVEADAESKDLLIDVTIPLQALVRNSQLQIPAHRPKAGLQGFFDPAPGAPKVLRIRYQFRGREHYAEIPDYMPVVLPLAEHLV
ncbi:hypothetical protein AX16_001174 [Volvariella volvacea WC 439]|nr:hypothetical protein AX16_001174 [Volvariella volvacea WC 439]